MFCATGNTDVFQYPISKITQPVETECSIVKQTDISVK